LGGFLTAAPAAGAAPLGAGCCANAGTAYAATANGNNTSRHLRSINIRPHGKALGLIPNYSSLTQFQKLGNEFSNQAAKPSNPQKRDIHHSAYVMANTAISYRPNFNGAQKFFGALGGIVDLACRTHVDDHLAAGRTAARKNELDDLLTAVGATRDCRAFAVLFDHFRPRVQAQLVRLGLAPAAAEDLTQDVMETIWQKAHLYDRSRSAAITWVFQIARNRRIDVKRRSRECCLPAEDFFTIPDPGAGCDEHIDAMQRQEYVRNALRVLPQEQLALVKLAFFEGLSHSAIAQHLNIPLGTVKSRLRLACVRLQRSLADSGLGAAY
jgi:RNA polymerase sigma-70 factor (ECF subfamily)